MDAVGRLAIGVDAGATPGAAALGQLSAEPADRTGMRMKRWRRERDEVRPFLKGVGDQQRRRAGERFAIDGDRPEGEVARDKDAGRR